MERRSFFAHIGAALAAAACALLPGRKPAAQTVIEEKFTDTGVGYIAYDKSYDRRQGLQDIADAVEEPAWDPPAGKQSPWDQRWWNIRGEEPYGIDYWISSDSNTSGD